MSGAAYEAMAVCGTIAGVVALIFVPFTFVELRWVGRMLAVSVLVAAALSATIGFLGVRSSAAASRHRECFTVGSVDNGQGWGHTAEIYATPHSYLPQSDDIVGAVSAGRSYCGTVENDPDHDLPVLVSVEKPLASLR